MIETGVFRATKGLDHESPEHEVAPFGLGRRRRTGFAERKRLRQPLLRPGLSGERRSFLLAPFTPAPRIGLHLDARKKSGASLSAAFAKMSR